MELNQTNPNFQQLRERQEYFDSVYKIIDHLPQETFFFDFSYALYRRLLNNSDLQISFKDYECLERIQKLCFAPGGIWAFKRIIKNVPSHLPEETRLYLNKKILQPIQLNISKVLQLCNIVLSKLPTTEISLRGLILVTKLECFQHYINFETPGLRRNALVLSLYEKCEQELPFFESLTPLEISRAQFANLFAVLLFEEFNSTRAVQITKKFFQDFIDFALQDDEVLNNHPHYSLLILHYGLLRDNTTYYSNLDQYSSDDQ